MTTEGPPGPLPLPPDDQERKVSGSHRKVRRLTRDGMLFAAGLAGLAYETTAHDAERPFLLMVFAGMIGLPAFIPKNEKDESSDDGQKK